MDFIKELAEARMTRNYANTRKLTYTDCCERAYLSLLVLEVLRQFPSSQANAKAYARQTTQYSKYNMLRMSAPDLYNFIYFIDGDDKVLDQLKDPEAAKQVRSRTHFPVMSVNNYLIDLAHGKTPNNVSKLFMDVETSLHISNTSYKSMRRTITSLSGASTQNIKDAITKLLFAVRAKLRSSDIIDDLEKLSADRNLESPRVVDTEPTVSVPDQSLYGADLVYLAQIVGQENLFMAKKFVELSKQGKTIPSNMTKAFNPAVQILVDIIQAGPSYVSLLKNVHQRAKKRQ